MEKYVKQLYIFSMGNATVFNSKEKYGESAKLLCEHEALLFGIPRTCPKIPTGVINKIFADVNWRVSHNRTKYCEMMNFISDCDEEFVIKKDQKELSMFVLFVQTAKKKMAWLFFLK